MSTHSKQDVYTKVTNKILADLEKGQLTWRKPWHAEHLAGNIMRPLRSNGLPYQGVNVIMLWASAVEQGFGAPTWMTLRQANHLGGKVRKGSSGSLVVYADRVRREEMDPKTGELEEREIPFMKGYTVFNVEQIEGLPEQYYGRPPAPPAGMVREEALERFFAATGADIRHGGNQAFYAIGHDFVQMPPFEAFKDAVSYYSTLGHEAVHWTRHPSRLDRDFGRKKYGDEGYAREELVAEIGSAFLCADLGITPETREDHAAYIGNWLQVLKNDKRFLFTAAAHAQRAIDHLQGYQPQAEEAAEDQGREAA